MKVPGHMVDGRAWDSFDGYLFDIDGTLLECADAVHYFAFCDALSMLAGRAVTLDGVTAHGNTDVGILRDALAHAGVPGAEWRPRLAEIQKRMAAFVKGHAHELRISVLPYVRELLQSLSSQGATLGIATGNLREIGSMKLEHAGLLNEFSIFGWSDDYEFRTDVFSGALKQMRALLKPGATICVVGDTPADIQAAAFNALPAIAVATGVYTRQQLETAAPALCLSSFRELFLVPDEAQHSQ